MLVLTYNKTAAMMIGMFPVLLQSLILASGGILSLGSTILVILLLLSDRGWHNGLGYTLGYTGAYGLIGMAFLLVNYDASGNAPTEQGIVVPLLFIILGLSLLYFSLHNWRKGPAEPGSKSSSRLFAIVDNATPLKTFAFGILLSVINFKNLAVFLSAISVVHLSDLRLVEKLISALLVTFVFCLSVIVPLLIYMIAPRRAERTLRGIKHTLDMHSRALGIWVPFVFGLLFLISGIFQLL